MLNVRDEEPVWESCLRWINHDVGSRKQYIKRLMEAVRLGLLNTSVIIISLEKYLLKNILNNLHINSILWNVLRIILM